MSGERDNKYSKKGIDLNESVGRTIASAAYGPSSTIVFTFTDGSIMGLRLDYGYDDQVDIVVIDRLIPSDEYRDAGKVFTKEEWTQFYNEQQKLQKEARRRQYESLKGEFEDDKG